MVWDFFIGFYSVITVFALAMMLRERFQKNDFNPVYSALGFLACLAWPVVAVFVMIAAMRRPASH